MTGLITTARITDTSQGMDFQDISLVASMPTNGQPTTSALASRVTDTILR